jgi:hypothetical protein
MMNKVALEIAEVSVEVTRPADTTAYSTNDVVSNSTSAPAVLTFSNCAAENEGSGYITKARVFTDSATALLGAQIRLNLYHTAPTAINDNAQFTLLYANAGNRIGYIDFPVLETGGTGSDSSGALWIDLPIQFKCARGSKALYGVPVLRTVGAAPASGQKLKFFLGIEKHS